MRAHRVGMTNHLLETLVFLKCIVIVNKAVVESIVD